MKRFCFPIAGWGLLALAFATATPARGQHPVAEVEVDFTMTGLPADATVTASCALRLIAGNSTNRGFNIYLLNSLAGDLKREGEGWRFRATTEGGTGSRHADWIDEALADLEALRTVDGVEVSLQLSCTAIPNGQVGSRRYDRVGASFTLQEAMDLLSQWRKHGLGIAGKGSGLTVRPLKGKGTPSQATSTSQASQDDKGDGERKDGKKH